VNLDSPYNTIRTRDLILKSRNQGTEISGEVLMNVTAKKLTITGSCHILQVFLLITPFPRFKNTQPDDFLDFNFFILLKLKISD